MERISRRRAVILLALFALVIVLFAVKLFDLQIIETQGNTDNTKTFKTITTVKAARGDLLDRNGNILIGNRASYDLVFNHYVIISSKGTNDYLYKLVKKCEELGVTYNDHFPVTANRPFEYTLDDYNTAWRGYFQRFLSKDWCDLDSDITAPLLVQELRQRYKIPETWSDEEARKIIGLRYELDLRNVTYLPTFTFMEDVSDEVLSAILELNTPGLMVESSTVREYHTKYAAHILGSMGALTKEQWEEIKEDENRKDDYSMDAMVGQSGFEAAFEDQLHAVDGTRVDVVAEDGTIMSQEYKEGKEPRAGNNVETTIDINIQMIAEDKLKQVMEDVRNPEKNEDKHGAGLDAEGAAVVVMKCKTGEVLACASYPSYDLETFSQDFDKLKEDPLNPMYNRALQAAYPPGSTFKMATMIAAMNNGIINLESTIHDDMVFDKYDGFRPVCLLYTLAHASHGDVDPVYALQVSCNYFFYVLGDTMKIEQIDEVAKGLGLGEPTGIELPENIGHRSNPESKAKQYKGAEGAWFPGDKVLTAIGQAENRFTPMQLAVYTSTLANEGTRYKATFLSRVVSDDYRKLIEENSPEIVGTQEICNDALQAIQKGMRQVILGVDGTARKYFGGPKDPNNYIPGAKWPEDLPVAAKTGTAETFKDRSDNSSFVCYAPADDPELVVVLYGERVGHPGVLVPVAEDIIRAYFATGEASDVPVYENKIS